MSSKTTSVGDLNLEKRWILFGLTLISLGYWRAHVIEMRNVKKRHEVARELMYNHGLGLSFLKQGPLTEREMIESSIISGAGVSTMTSLDDQSVSAPSALTRDIVGNDMKTESLKVTPDNAQLVSLATRAPVGSNKST